MFQVIVRELDRYILILRYKTIINYYAVWGPEEDPDDCGLPILCIFYVVIVLILCVTVYTTIKGSKDWWSDDVFLLIILNVYDRYRNI